MSNERRQFLGLAAGAIAVPATSSLVVAQGDPSRGREAPMRESTLADTVKIVAEHGGGSGVAFAWETQLLGASKR